MGVAVRNRLIHATDQAQIDADDIDDEHDLSLTEEDMEGYHCLPTLEGAREQAGQLMKRVISTNASIFFLNRYYFLHFDVQFLYF